VVSFSVLSVSQWQKKTPIGISTRHKLQISTQKLNKFQESGLVKIEKMIDKGHLFIEIC